MSKLPTLLVTGSLLVLGKPVEESPIKYIQAWIRTRMPEFGNTDVSIFNRILILRSETGSGKSTVLPVGIFRLLRNENTNIDEKFNKPSVICTQPRVLTAMQLAMDVSSERNIGGLKMRINPDMILGKTVGYQTGPISDKSAGLLYATIGILTTQLQYSKDSEFIGKYRFIIIDEAHERSLSGDMTLMLLKNFYTRNAGNPKLPFLILTSATFDTIRYANYFGVGESNIMEVVGRSYPININWPDHSNDDYISESAKTAIKIHEENINDSPAKADILIFVPGAAEAKELSKQLDVFLSIYEEKKIPSFLLLVISRDIIISKSSAYRLIFTKHSELPKINGSLPVRRIIVSTIVAETGLTVDTLKYVIDCGWNRTKEVYHPWNVEGLITRPAPKSRILQRQGRVGRLFPGEFYPMYKKNAYDALDIQQIPDIISNGINEVFLTIVCEQHKHKIQTNITPEFKIEDISLLDPPSPIVFLTANTLAYTLGFISTRAPLSRTWPPSLIDQPLALSRGYGITETGYIASLFNYTSMEAIRVLFGGYIWKVAASDLITAVSLFGLRISDLFLKSLDALPGALPLMSEALREALPSYLTQYTGGGSNFVIPPTELEAFYFRSRLLIVDDFIEVILIFEAYLNKIEAAKGDMTVVSKWCKAKGINITNMIALSIKRNDLIKNMIIIGLDPFRLHSHRISIQSIENFTETIRSIKRCLYDGLKSKLLKYDDKHQDGPAYYTLQGLKVTTPPLFTDAMAARLNAINVTENIADIHPKWIITDTIEMKIEKPGISPLLYIVKTNLVSVLDGYVDPDENLNDPRVL